MNSRWIYVLGIAIITLGCADQAWALKFRANFDPIIICEEPGTIANRTVSLTLAEDEKPTHFKVHAEDYWRSEDTRQSYYREPGTVPHSCALWVQINPVEQLVNPGESLNTRISVTIPKDAKPGGYWCAITIDEVPNPDAVKPEGIGLYFNTSVSIALFVFIPPLERIVKITDVQVTADGAMVKLRNDGNCPLLVEGRFEFLRPGEAKPCATVSISLGALLLDPVNSRIFAEKLPAPKELPTGRYLVRAILDVGLDHYLGVQKELEITRETTPAPQDGQTTP